MAVVVVVGVIAVICCWQATVKGRMRRWYDDGGGSFFVVSLSVNFTTTKFCSEGNDAGWMTDREREAKSTLDVQDGVSFAQWYLSGVPLKLIALFMREWKMKWWSSKRDNKQGFSDAHKLSKAYLEWPLHMHLHVINQGVCWNDSISMENKSRLMKNLLFIDGGTKILGNTF